MNVQQWQVGTAFSHEPLRPRKLLLHRDEIKRLTGKLNEKGYTLVALRLYIKDGRAKVELGLARGKRQYDKRRTLAKRDAEREMARAARKVERGE
jgi:SsrA-binding protein